jgi:hypothetical protein
MRIPRGHPWERLGRAFLDRAPTPPELNEDGPTIMSVATPAADEDDGTYQTPNR